MTTKRWKLSLSSSPYQPSRKALDVIGQKDDVTRVPLSPSSMERFDPT